jgi:hypothetical protein
VLLDGDEFDARYHEAFAKPQFSPAWTEEHLALEFGHFNRLVERALSNRWITYDYHHRDRSHDFVIGDEWQDCFHHCSGIYSSRIATQRYLRVLASVMATLPHADSWVYHTAIEVSDFDYESQRGCFLKSGKAYFSGEDRLLADRFR